MESDKVKKIINEEKILIRQLKKLCIKLGLNQATIIACELRDFKESFLYGASTEEIEYIKGYADACDDIINKIQKIKE